MTVCVYVCRCILVLCCNVHKHYDCAAYTGVILFRALYLGGYDITKDHFDIEHASLTTRFIAAQVLICTVLTRTAPYA